MRCPVMCATCTCMQFRSRESTLPSKLLCRATLLRQKERTTMRQFSTIGSISFVSVWLLLGGTAHAANAPSYDAEALQGTWTAVKAELAGKPMSEAELGVITLTIKNDS